MFTKGEKEVEELPSSDWAISKTGPEAEDGSGGP